MYLLYTPKIHFRILTSMILLRGRLFIKLINEVIRKISATIWCLYKKGKLGGQTDRHTGGMAHGGEVMDE